MQLRVSTSISSGELVNPTTLPTPQEYEWELEDIDSESAGRNQSGLMFRDRVATKRKLVCKFAPQYTSTLSTILQAINGQFFYLEYPDAMTGAKRIMYCYAGSKSVKMIMYKGSDNYLWDCLEVNFIER